jgi:hypothetical protein
MCVCFVLFFFFFFVLFPFSLYFVVMAYWVVDVNNFMACELRRMSFGKKILLFMYRIESV